MAANMNVELSEVLERRRSLPRTTLIVASIWMVAGVLGLLNLLSGDASGLDLPGTGQAQQLQAADAAVTEESLPPDSTGDVVAGVDNSDDDPVNDPVNNDADYDTTGTPAAAIGDDYPPSDDLAAGDDSLAPDPLDVAESSAENGAPSARFVALPEPVQVLDTTIDPAAGNATGFDVTSATIGLDGLSNEDVVAVVANVVVDGNGPGDILFHPGNRPEEALRLPLSDSGQLRVPHVLLHPDNEGRVVIAADPTSLDDASAAATPTLGAEVSVTVSAVYVRSDASAAGRYWHLGVAEAASLVTSIDGRDVTLDIADLVGPDASTVGHVVLRFNANVGSDGGSVSQMGGDGYSESSLSTWGPQARVNPGLGGTGVAVVPVDEDGEIKLRYKGGSILQVDAVGYFTNDKADVSSQGLLAVSTPRSIDADYAKSTDGTVDLILGDVTGGSEAGNLMVRQTNSDSEQLVFNLAADQRRLSPVWVADYSELEWTGTSDVTLWWLGSFQP